MRNTKAYLAGLLASWDGGVGQEGSQVGVLLHDFSERSQLRLNLLQSTSLAGSSISGHGISSSVAEKLLRRLVRGREGSDSDLQLLGHPRESEHFPMVH